MCACVRECVCVCIIQSSSRITFTYCHSLFHVPFNNVIPFTIVCYVIIRGMSSLSKLNIKRLTYEAVNTYFVMHTYKMRMYA